MTTSPNPNAQWGSKDPIGPLGLAWGSVGVSLGAYWASLGLLG